jgi:NAD-dependent dihydropyrimidine dehydrogenase PreA subunit
MKKDKLKKLTLHKKTVSVLHTAQLIALKGGEVMPFTKQSDSYVQCGSCHSNCPTNSTVCGGDAPEL